MEAMSAAGAAQAPKKPLYLQPAVWKLLLMALLAEMGYAMLNISTMPVYLKYDRGFGTGVIGLVLVAFLLSEAIFKSPMGAIADRFGRKRLIVIGPSLSVLTATLTVMVPHGAGASETLCFIVLRLLDGVGAAMLWPAAFALMGDIVEDKDRQQAMSLLNMCYLAGVGIALPFGGWANDLIGPHLPLMFQKSPGLFFSATLFAAVAATAYIAFPSDEKEPKHQGEHGEINFVGLLESIHLIPQYLLLAVVTFMGIGFPMAIVKIFALDQFGMSESQFGALVLPAVGSMALLSVPMSKLGDRIGRARAVHIGMFLCFAGLAFISSGLLIPVFRAPWVFAVGGLPVGLGFLLAIPAWMASVSEIDPNRRAASLGAVMTAQGVGAIIGAPIGAFLYERLQPVGKFLGVYSLENPGDFARFAPFAGCAACVLAGWLLSLRILRSKSAEIEHAPDQAVLEAEASIPVALGAAQTGALRASDSRAGANCDLETAAPKDEPNDEAAPLPEDPDAKNDAVSHAASREEQTTANLQLAPENPIADLPSEAQKERGFNHEPAEEAHPK